VGRFSIHNANTKKIQEEHRTGLLHFGKLKAKFLEIERRWDEVKRGEMQYDDFSSLISSNCFENAKFSINRKLNEKSCISLFSTPVGTE
jgi:hypothetical protein